MGIFEDLTKPISQQSDTSGFDFDAYLQEKIKPYKKKTVAPDSTSEFTPEKVTSNIDKITNFFSDAGDALTGFGSEAMAAVPAITEYGMKQAQRLAENPIGAIINNPTNQAITKLTDLALGSDTSKTLQSVSDKTKGISTFSAIDKVTGNSLTDATNEMTTKLSDFKTEVRKKIPDSFWGRLGASGADMALVGGASVGTGLLTGNPAAASSVAYGLSTALEGGALYDTLKEKGLSEDESLKVSGQIGAIIGLLDSIVPGKLGSKAAGEIGKKLSGNLLKRMVKSNVITEIGTENLQELISTATEYNYSTKEERDELIKRLPQQALETTAMSALMGGAMQVVGKGLDIKNEKSRTKLEEEFGTGEEITTETVIEPEQIAKPEVEEVKLTPEQQLKKIRNDAISTEYKATIKNIDDSKAEIRREVNRLNGELKIAKNNNEIIDEKRISGELAKLKEQLKSLDSQRKTAKEDAIKKIDEVENLKENEPTEGLTQEKSPVDLFNERMKPKEVKLLNARKTSPELTSNATEPNYRTQPLTVEERYDATNEMKLADKIKNLRVKINEPKVKNKKELKAELKRAILQLNEISRAKANKQLKETNFEQQTADLQKLTPTEATEPQTPVKGMEVKAEEKTPVIEDTFAKPSYRASKEMQDQFYDNMNQLPAERQKQIKDDYYLERDEVQKKYQKKWKNKTSISEEEFALRNEELKKIDEKYFEIASKEKPKSEVKEPVKEEVKPEGDAKNTKQAKELIKNATHLNDVEKTMLQRQYDSGAMTLDDIKKYTTYDIGELYNKKGEINKWANAIINTEKKGEIKTDTIEEAIIVEDVKPNQQKPEVPNAKEEGKTLLETPGTLTKEDVKLKETSESLIEEAKKYKSADEFVKNQNNPDKNNVYLYRGMTKKFDPKFDLSKTDAPQGYSTWTDNIDLAKEYAGENGFIYKIALPKNKLGKELIDNDGERVLYVNNKKKAGLNNVSGDEYLVYNSHDNYSPALISQAYTKQQLTDIWNKANTSSPVKETVKAEPVNQPSSEQPRVEAEKKPVDKPVSEISKAKEVTGTNVSKVGEIPAPQKTNMKESPNGGFYQTITHNKGKIKNTRLLYMGKDGSIITNEYAGTGKDAKAKADLEMQLIKQLGFNNSIDRKIVERVFSGEKLDEVLKDYPELSPSKDRIVEQTGATGTDAPVSKRVFSEEGYKQDRKDANDILNRPNLIGAQLEAVPQMLRIAGYHLENVTRAGIEKGRQFTEWTKSMIKDLGGKIRPYLKKIWGETQRQFGKKLLEYAEKNPFIRGMNVVEGSLFTNDNLPPVRKYTDKDLEVLFEKNPVVRKKVSEFTKKTKETADDILRPMSAEIEQIDKDTYAAIKENDFETLAETNRRIKQITPFLEKFVRFRKYQPKEFAKLSYYLTANNMVEAEKIMSKWKMSEAFKPVRDALNELYVEGVKVKYDLGYLKDYFPRDMVDYEGYLKEIRGKKAFDVFQELIDKKNAERKKKGEAVLTTDEENKLITNAIRGYNPGISLSGIANYKERVIKAFPPSYAKYYDTAENALINYIVKATDAIQQRKLFGYGVDAEASIASYIKGKGLDAEKSAKLKRILKARYNFMSNKWASQVRGIMYLTTLNNPTSSIKNLADVPMALYNSGSLTKTFVALGRALVDKSVIKMEDAGLHNMGGEYMNLSSRNKATNAMMKWMLAFPYFDKVGKETYINATMSKYHKLANSNPDKLKTKLGKWFNEERASQVVSDLRQKKSYKDIGKTNLLNLVAYLEISDVQPTTMTEMPLKYAESPNGRVLYTMKSFQLKRLDFFRKETLHKIRTKGQRLEGFRNLAMLTTMIGLGEAGTEQIISWLLGRDESFTEQIADSMLSIIGFNRYDVEKAKRTNPIDVIFNKALPIATPLKDLWDDYETAADNYELTRYLTTHKTDRPFKAKSLNALPWVRTIRKNIENR